MGYAVIVHILHHGLVLCGEPLGPNHKWTSLEDARSVTCERCARIALESAPTVLVPPLPKRDDQIDKPRAGRHAHHLLSQAAVLARRAGWDAQKFQDEAFAYFDAEEKKEDHANRDD